MLSYKIFLSGPSDVNEFIEIARSTIQEINILAGPLGIHFESFDWLENATPGIGDEPQSVINEQAIGYSAILAVLGAKVGSPTKEFESGTIEEIEKAILIADSLPFGSKSVMVFFKDTAIDLKSADLEQAAKIQKLRSSLGPKGILFKDFKDENKFKENLLRCFGIMIAKHLSSKSQDLSDSDNKSSVSAIKIIDSESLEIVSAEEIDEPGLLDLNDLQTALMGQSSEGLHRISLGMAALTQYMTEKSLELDEANKSKDNARIKRIISDISSHMISLSETIDNESMNISSNYRESTQHLRALVDLWSSDFSGPDSDAQMEELRVSVIELLSSIIEAKDGISSYASAVRSLPRITKEINAAKRKLVASNDRYFSMLSDVEAETESLLDFINAGNVSDPLKLN